MSKSMSLSDKQYMAKILFTREKLDQKLVAEKVGISEQTMSSWVNKFNWKELRRRLLVSKEEMLANMYEQLEELNTHIQQRKPGERFGNTKEADIQVKLTAAIRNLETELAIADIVESGIRFIKFIQHSGGEHDEAREIAEKWNAFIQTQIKR